MRQADFDELPRKELTEAIYSQSPLADYLGNPLIEALPEINSLKQSVGLLANLPPVVDIDTNIDDHLKLHALQQLNRVYQPLPQHLLLEQKISILIRQGYVAREYEGREFIERFNNAKYLQSPKYKTKLKPLGTATSFGLIGCAGMGKTLTTEKVLDNYPQVLNHKGHGFLQIVWMKLNCPHDGSVKQLCINFFKEVDRLLGTSLQRKYCKPKSSIDELQGYIADVANMYNLGVLVIDEIQHLNSAKTKGDDQMLNFLVSLVNFIGVPVIKMGTPSSMTLLQKALHEARRNCGMGFVYWDRLAKEDDWELLVTTLWQYQWLEQQLELSNHIKSVLYDLTQGVVDILVKLLILSQMRAIINGDKQLTVSVIQETFYEDLSILVPYVNALKENLNDDKLDDFARPDFDKIIAEKISRYHLQQAKTAINRSQVNKESQAEKKEITKMRTENMEEGDLRRITAEGKENGLTNYEALKRAGLISLGVNL